MWTPRYATQNLEEVTKELEKAVSRRQTVELMALELKKEVGRQKFATFKVRTRHSVPPPPTHRSCIVQAMPTRSSGCVFEHSAARGPNEAGPRPGDAQLTDEFVRPAAVRARSRDLCLFSPDTLLLLFRGSFWSYRRRFHCFFSSCNFAAMAVQLMPARPLHAPLLMPAPSRVLRTAVRSRSCKSGCVSCGDPKSGPATNALPWSDCYSTRSCSARCARQVPRPPHITSTATVLRDVSLHPFLSSRVCVCVCAEPEQNVEAADR